MEPVAFDVQPVKPAAGYIGGKRNLAKRICSLIAATPHTGYYEPFVGMGGIFLRRASRPRAEAINDISGDVVTLFRVLREHGPEFIAYLRRWWITSRAEFDRLKAIDPARAQLTDFTRAARFLYLQRLAFGGKVTGRHFGVDSRTPAGFDVTKLEPLLEALHMRLAPVTIEQLPFCDFIRRYDHDGALFYLDPPYLGCEDDYGAGVFAREDFERLAEQLAGIRGGFILSINDTPNARAVFDRFSMERVEVSYLLSAASAGGAKRVGELIVRNRPGVSPGSLGVSAPN